MLAEDRIAAVRPDEGLRIRVVTNRGYRRLALADRLGHRPQTAKCSRVTRLVRPELHRIEQGGGELAGRLIDAGNADGQ